MLLPWFNGIFNYSYMRSNKKPLRYFLYCRKSSEGEERQALSIDSQISEMKKLVGRDGLKVVKTFTEAHSAKEPGARPEFNEMVERIKKGEANGIVCWKLDRLARNPVDGGIINWMLQQGIIQHIRAYDRDYYPTDNVLMMFVELGMANQYIIDLRHNTARGLRTKAEMGIYPSHAPTGYLNTPNLTGGSRCILIDKERFPIIQRAFREMLTGQYTVQELWRVITHKWGFRMDNGKPIGRSTFYRMFTLPFYYGRYEYPQGSGNWYDGKHPAMITKEEFDQIQDIISGRNKPRPKKFDFAFRGPLRCGECGAMITAELRVKKQKNGNTHVYTYYHCTKQKNPNCSQRYVQEKEIEEQITDILNRIEIPNDFCVWALEKLKNETQQKENDQNIIVSNLEKSLASCLKKLDTIVDMRINGEISETVAKEKKAEINKEKENLEYILSGKNNQEDKSKERAGKIFSFAQIAREKFQENNIFTKRSILSGLGSNLLLKDGKVLFQAQKPLVLLEEASKEVKEIKKNFEPPEDPLTKRTLATLYDQSPTLLRGPDLNREPQGYGPCELPGCSTPRCNLSPIILAFHTLSTHVTKNCFIISLFK